MTKDLTQASAAELGKLYGKGKASPVETMKAVLARAEKLATNVNALCHVDADAALAAARDSEKRWKKSEPLSPLDGVPVSIKELVRVKGWPASMGSKLTDKTPADADAPAVARLREAGAIVFAQSTSSEYGHKGLTDSPLHGITRNPWNTGMTPGGSSGGAGAAVAAGLGPIAIGTDGGGSVRIPASFNGLIGLKATLGRVPAWPPSMTGDLSNTGPMARTVLDAALMMNAIARPDARDGYGLPGDDTDYTKKLNKFPKKLKVGFALRFGDHPHRHRGRRDGDQGRAPVRGAGLHGRNGRGAVFLRRGEPRLRDSLAGRTSTPAAGLPRGAPSRVRPEPADRRQGRPALHLAGRGERTGRTARSHHRLEPVLREIRPAAHADRGGAAVRGRHQFSSRPRRQAQHDVVALHAAVQPDAPSRRDGAVRPVAARPAGRPADCFGPLQRRADPARRRRLRRCLPVEIFLSFRRTDR